MPTGKVARGAVALFALPLMVAAAPAPNIAAAKGNAVAHILAASEKTMDHLSSFHVSGEVVSSGTSASLNLSMSPSGGGGSVTEPGAVLEIVVAGKTAYVKADEKSWQTLTGNKAVAELVANRWIKAPVSNPDFTDLADFTISTDFISSLFGSASGVTLAGKARVGAREAVVLTDGQGDDLYIAEVGAPYVLRVKGHGSSGSLNFSDFGDAPLPATPVNAIPLPS